MPRTVRITSIQIPVELLTFGMFISYLDRPWIGTPFLLQGFWVNHPEEMTAIKDYCQAVWVDITTIPASIKLPPNLPRRSSSTDIDQRTAPSTANLAGLSGSKQSGKAYPIKHAFEEELPRASASLNHYSDMVTTTFDSLAEGKNLDLKKIRQATRPMIESMIVNPDAMIWLSRLESRGDYTLKHALCVSVWAVALGRQLGLPKHNLIELSIAGMLADIGKLWIDEGVLNKPGPLTPDERKLARSHVERGIEALDTASKGQLNSVIRSAIQYHHERHSGQGYPEQRFGGSIPLFAKIVGIADYYDAVTTDRCYATAVSSGEALKAMYDARNKEFQAELVEEFIQAIGIYPAGSVVQLSDNTVALVIAAGRSQRLHPRVIRVLDNEGQRPSSKTIIDLAKQDNQLPENRVHIVKSLAGHQLGFDLHDYFL